MNVYTKPLPEITPWSKKFWEATKQHKLSMQKCNSCGKLIFYPRKACPDCWSLDLGWQEVSGKAKLKSFTITMGGVEPVFAPDLPYVLAIVDLAEGPTMMTNIVDCKHEDLKIGMDLQVTFRDCTDTISLPVFRPA
jgi:uncharacterized OB-fold protein